jgi:Zn-dependent alcohol dehydrogenase
MNMMADLPRFVRLVETGQFDAETILGRTYTLDEARDAFQDAADRTVISAVVTFG